MALHETELEEGVDRTDPSAVVAYLEGEIPDDAALQERDTLVRDGFHVSYGPAGIRLEGQHSPATEREVSGTFDNPLDWAEDDALVAYADVDRGVVRVDGSNGSYLAVVRHGCAYIYDALKQDPLAGGWVVTADRDVYFHWHAADEIGASDRSDLPRIAIHAATVLDRARDVIDYTGRAVATDDTGLYPSVDDPAVAGA